MSCSGDFLPKIELRRNDTGGDFIAQSAGHPEPLALGDRRAGDDDHTIEAPLNTRFIQQRDIDANPVFPRFRDLDKRSPALADARVKNFLQIAPRLFIGEDEFTQCRAIRRSIFMENSRSKSRANRFTHGQIVREQLSRTLIRIEKLRR